MPVRNHFNPEILQSEFRLRQFFRGDQAIQEISNSASKETPYRPSLYFNRWKVVWIYVTYPFQMIFKLFLKGLEAIAYCLGAENLSIRCEIWMKHCERKMEQLLLQRKYKENLLCPSFNCHAKDTGDVFLQKPLLINSIENSWVKDRTLYLVNFQMIFLHLGGNRAVCRGESQWFLYLYFQTLGRFSSPFEHVKAVGKIFEKGAPREAALLQSFNDLDKDVLCFQTDRKFATLTPEILSNENQAKKQIEDLPNGAYQIAFSNHRAVYIKIDQDLGFIFDPNDGVISAEKENHTQAVLDFFKSYTNRVEDKTIKLGKVTSLLQTESQEKVATTASA